MYRVLYWKMSFEGWIMRVSFSVTLALHRLPSETWISKLEMCVTHLILKDLNNGPELNKLEKKVMTFRHFFCKPNILLILVCDENFQTWDVYVSLCWKKAEKIRRRFSQGTKLAQFKNYVIALVIFCHNIVCIPQYILIY